LGLERKVQDLALRIPNLEKEGVHITPKGSSNRAAFPTNGFV
jgi:hypothetical protein